MKIAILTCGLLPIPAVQGGAVENLIDFYLAYNDQLRLHDITIYSPKNAKTCGHPALSSEVNHYRYIDVSSLTARVARRIRSFWHSGEYYNYFIEYYFERVFADLKKKNYDCILLENCPGYAYKLSQRGYRNLVLHLHNDLLNGHSRHHDVIFQGLSKIICVSDFVSRQVATIQSSNKIKTIYNGIDLQCFTRKSTTTVNRKKLGFAEDDFIMVYSGRINKDKGISQLIDTLLLLKDQPKIKLMVLGSSFFNDANGENAFIRQLKEKSEGIQERIVFTGFIPYPLVPDYLQTGDIAVLPSMWDEPFGLTVVEAMAVGLPLITTNSGGIPEICEGVATIVEREDIVNNLVSSILDLYKHSDKRRQMATAALQRAQKFDKETYARSFLKALEG